ncbi:MAG: hypothetical protein GYA24_08445 [Candidatus Lokiarchaeota archaeon]|nr:hypothetical protein [Candidatus Lokiarchaeota archaeon]
MTDASMPRLACQVKNCQKQLQPGEQIVIGGQVFCKSCAVDYFKDLLGADARYD